MQIGSKLSAKLRLFSVTFAILVAAVCAYDEENENGKLIFTQVVSLQRSDHCIFLRSVLKIFIITFSYTDMVIGRQSNRIQTIRGESLSFGKLDGDN